jgi:hypothetical protein
MADTCTNTWEAKDREGKPFEKTCGFELKEAKKARGKALVRCPECGRKLNA